MRTIACLGLMALSVSCLAGPTDRAEAWRLLNERQFTTLDAAFNEAQRRYESGYKDVPDAEREIARAFRVFYFADESTGPMYDAWVKAYPQSYAASLARGEYLTALAWKRRGSDFARGISPDQWTAMHSAAAAAVAELTRSLALAVRPVLSYEFLIEIAMITGSGRGVELLVDARKLDAHAYYASRAFLTGLRPQWGGSLEEMRSFVASFRQSNAPAWKVNCLEAQVADIESSETVSRDPAHRLAAQSRAIELCPQANRYNARAHLHREMKQFDLAEKDYRDALRLDSGDQWARASLGLLIVDRGKAEEGVAMCREAAAALEPNAFQCLAFAYKFGKGVPRDTNEVVRWLERAAAAGQRAGMNDLAGHYWRGEGVAQNKGRAVELWQRSASKGYEPARSRLKELGYSP